MWENTKLIDEILDSDELKHHGIKGQKWGVRRSQATLDRLAGRNKKFKRETKVEKVKRKSVKDMTASELREEINRRALVTKLTETKGSKSAIGRFLDKRSANKMTQDELKKEIERTELKNQLKDMKERPKAEARAAKEAAKIAKAEQRQLEKEAKAAKNLKVEPANDHLLAKKKVSELTNEELKRATERARAENAYAAEKEKGKSWVGRFFDKARDKAADTALDVGSTIAKEKALDFLRKKVGLVDEEVENLKRETTIENLKSKAAENTAKAKTQKIASEKAEYEFNKKKKDDADDAAEKAAKKAEETKKNQATTNNSDNSNNQKGSYDSRLKSLNKEFNDDRVSKQAAEIDASKQKGTGVKGKQWVKKKIEGESNTSSNQTSKAKSMAKSGDSISEIAEQLDVSTSTVSKMLGGKTASTYKKQSNNIFRKSRDIDDDIKYELAGLEANRQARSTKTNTAREEAIISILSSKSPFSSVSKNNKYDESDVKNVMDYMERKKEGDAVNESIREMLKKRKK